MALTLEYFYVLVAVSSIVCEALACNDQFEYPWEKKGNLFCCSKCPPGKSLKDRCSGEKQAPKCTSCPDGKYAAQWNTYTNCVHCKDCSEGNGARYTKRCDAKSDAKCECLPGFLLHQDDAFSFVCKRICESGTELKDDLKTCQPCQVGYFADHPNTQCKPWTDCAATGQTLIENGSARQNTVCGSAVPTVSSLVSSGISTNISASTSTPATSIATILHTPRRTTTPPAVQPIPSRETTILVVILLVSLFFVIVLIGKRVICFQIKNQVFHQCFGTRCGRKTPIPVQEECDHIVTV